MGETENTEISDESEPTEEQIKEEEEEVIPDEAGLGETVPTEEEVTEEPAKVQEEQETVTEETDEMISAVAVADSGTDSLETPASTKILIKGVTKGGDDADVLGTLEHATVYFTDGCSNDEGTEVRNNVPITFRVRANAGYKVKSVKFGADAEEANLDTPAKAAKEPGKEGTGDQTLYTIPTAEFVGKDADGKDVNNKHVLIVVETEGVKYTVKPAISASGVKVNTVETTTGATPTTSLQEITSTGKAFDSAETGTITLAMSGMAAGKTYNVTAYAGDDTTKAEPLTAGTENEVTGGTKYIPYTLTFSDLDGLNYYVDQEITVTVAEVEAVTVTGSAITKEPAAYDGTIGADADINEAATKNGYVPYAEDGTYKPKDKVVFTITPKANSDWAEVKAADIDASVEKGTDKKPADVAAGKVEGVTVAEGVETFTVTIPEVDETGYTLKIKVNAELGEKAKTITFATAGNAAKDQVVTIKGGDTMDVLAEIKSASIKTMAASSYAVDISSREGYQLQSVKVKVTGTYDADKTSYTGEEYTLDEAANYGEEGHEDVESNYPRYRVKTAISLTGNDKDGKAWTATAVAVTVNVAENIEGADEEKQVTFASGTKASSGATGNPYTFKVKESKDEDGKDLVKYEGNDGDKTSGTVTIAEGVQYLEFSVAADTEPEVELKLNGEDDAADTTGLLETVSEAAGNYEYRVAAKALIGKKGHISITREKKELHVATDGVATVAYTNTEDDENESQNGTLNTDGNVEVDINAPLDIVVTHEADAVPIKSVTYKVGEDGAEKTVEPDNGAYSFQVKADDNVIVTVKRVEDERLFVTDIKNPGNEIEVAPGSVVEANYEDDIKAYLRDADGDKIALMRATVYDGEKLAETKASVNVENEAVISKIAKNEYEKELTVTLMKEDRTTVSFKIISDKAVEGDITFSDKGELNADTTLKLNVSAKAGTVNKLRAAAVPFAAAVPEKAPAEISASGSTTPNIAYCDLTGGTLTITAAALEAGVADAGYILVYDSTDAEKKVLGSLKVSVKDPVMKGVTADAEAGLSDGRTVSVKITVPGEVKNEDLEAGVLGYKIKVTAPAGLASMAKPGADWTDAEWAATRKSAVDNLDAYKDGKFVELSDILNKNGYTIRVIDEYVRNADGSKTAVRPAAISGIKITVTPVQYTGVYGAEGSKEIAGTSKDVTMDTAAPVYSDTLKLGKGGNTVLTGQDEDIVVATPEFAKDAKYKSVDVTMINSATGIVDDDWNGAFDPKWNPANGTVTVNAKDADYYGNASGSYKNLAIKVTAWTEAGDYGVSGVKKLTVKNGIQYLDLTVQPEILFTGKKVTAKSAIVYNNENYYKQVYKYNTAPSKKAVTYRIVGADSELLYDNDLTEKPLSANLSAVVDNKGTKAVDVNPKSGQITVAAGFTFGKNNTFRVLAEAADYAGNPTKALSDPITIISEDTELGGVAVLEKNAKGQWVKATGDLKVGATSGQYCLVMLKPGVGEKPNGYDLNKDTVDLNLLDVKSSNKSIELGMAYNNDTYRTITVKKLGKTNFTMTAKSNNRNKAELKNVNFVMDDAELYVELTRYQDSTFDKAIGTQWYNASEIIPITGNTTGYFSANLVKKADSTKEISKANTKPFALPNCSFGFKNAKQVKPLGKSASTVYFVATGGGTDKNQTVFTVTNKGVRPANKIELKIRNAAADALSGNAPKLTLTDKKQRIVADTNVSNAYFEYWRENDVSITVTASKKGEEIPADTYVMLSADQTKKTKANTDNVFDGFLDTAIRLDKTGDSTAKFNVTMRTNQAESYTLIATLGTMEGGVFTQTHKEARIILRAVKPNFNIKATGSYTLNPYGASSAKLAISGGDNPVRFDGYSNLDKTGKIDKNFNYAKNVIKKDGTPNRFNKFFIVTAKEGTNLIDSIKINPALTKDELSEMETDKDFAKNDTTGYITITNGEKTMDVKLTVKIKLQKDMKPKATVTPVIEGKDVITDIQITDGKNPIALAAYQAEGASFKAYYSDAIKANKVVVDGKEITEEEAEQKRLAKGIIRMKAAEAKKGNDPITLKVLLADTVDAYRVKNDTMNPDPMKNGVDITGVKVTIAAGTTTNKVVVSNSDKNWVVQRTEWNTWKDEESGYEFYGWSTQKDFSFKNRLGVPAGQKIVVESDTSYVRFDECAYSVDGKGKLNIDLDKAELVAAMEAPRSKAGWGKKVNVKATFTYPGVAEEGKEAPELFKSDVVTFSITLPEKEGYESAEVLRNELNQKALQNFVDVKTAEEHRYAQNDEDYTFKQAAGYVAALLKNEVLDMAKGTTAVIATTGDYSDGLYTYKLNVGEGTPYTYNVLAETPTVDTVSMYIKNTYGNLTETEPDDKETAKTLGLQFHPDVTQAADLTATLRDILTKKNLLTRNISVNVTGITCKPPKAGTGADNAGKLTATVEIKDSNKEPYAFGYSTTAKIDYTFSPLEETDKFTTDATTGLLAKLKADVDDGSISNMTQIFSDAYRTSGGDIDEENVIGPKMQAALIAGIEKFAGEQITTNPYLTVKGIDADNFECEWNNSNGWKLVFKMIYADATPGTDKPEIPVEIKATDNLTVTWTAVPSNQDATGIKTDAEAAFEDAHYLIKNVQTAEAAETVITEMIKKVILNPKYVAADSLKVKTADPAAENFTAPTTDVNGMITVDVIYDAKEETPSVKENYTFVIVKKDELLGDTTTEGEDGTEITTPNLDDHAKAEDLVKAALTADKLDKIVQDAWETYAATDNNTAENFASDTGVKTAVEDAVTSALSAGKIASVALINANPVTIGTITLPTGSAETATGSIAEIKVALKDVSTTGGDAWDGTEGKGLIKITNVTLKGNELFQTEEEFIADVKSKLAAGIAYKDTYFTDNDSSKGIAEDKISDIVGDIKTAVGAMEADNPLWNQSSYARNAEVATTDPDGKETAPAATGLALENVKLTLGTGANKTSYVTVKLCEEEDMSLIKSVTIKKIGADVTGKDGLTESNAIEIANSNDVQSLDLLADVEGTTGATAEDKEYKWSLATSDGTAFNPETKDGVQDKIKVEDNKLIIPKDAYTANANGKVVIQLTATATGTATAVGKKTDTRFVAITLTEAVTGITLTNSVDNKTVQTTFEAPATGGDNVTYTFGYELVGSHIKEATKATFIAPTADPEDANVTWVAGADSATVTLTVKPGAKDHSGAKAFKLAASVGGYTGAKLDVDTITIKSNETAGKETTLGFDTTGVTEESDWGWKDATTNPARDGILTIQNKDENDVWIPITITGGETRDWSKWDVAVKTSNGTFDKFTEDSKEIEVKSGADKPNATKAEKTKTFLVVHNAMPEIEAAKEAGDNSSAVQALVLTLSATSTAKGGLAAVTTSLDFEIVVDKTFTGIDIAHNSDAGESYVSAENDGSLTVTKQSGETTVTLAATVNGAHVNATTDQGVTWKVLTKGAKSDAAIAPTTGVLTFSEDSVDNVINVQAISTVDKSVTGTIRIRVITG